MSTNDGDNRVDEATSPSRGLKRAVEKAADKLSRSRSAGKSPQLPPPTSPPSRRRFSLNRKSRSDRVRDADSGDMPPSVTASMATLTNRRVSGDESPFIRPPSPGEHEHPLARSLFPFRGDASMRMGTQTLIQALQALPWSDEVENEDEAQHEAHDAHSGEGESDSNDESKSDRRMASSIHTIHRPIARSKRAGLPIAYRDGRTLNAGEYFPDVQETSEPEEAAGDDVEDEDDFEGTQEGGVTRPRAIPKDSEAISAVVEKKGREASGSKNAQSRSGTMATVRLKRRARLADKLRDVFELPGIEEVLAEMPCWLLRSILLQGYMYLTNSYLCFFAHMPSKEDQVLKSGALSKKANRTRRWIKHWFVLKNDALSWYQSSADPYFPHGVVDLRYAISCEGTSTKDIRIRTNQKTILLSADSEPSRNEWVKAIKKVMFKAQHTGDSVKIAIPYSAILDVDKSTAMDFSETIEVKVVDQEDHFSVDSYFFAYFTDLSGALDQIRDAVRTHRAQAQSSVPQTVLDTTQQQRSPIPSPRLGTTGLPSVAVPASDSTPASSPRLSAAGFKLSSLWRPFSEPVPHPASSPPTRMRSVPEHAVQELTDEFTHVNKRGESSFVPTTTSPKARATSAGELSASASAPAGVGLGLNVRPDHTYPPSTSSSELLAPPSAASTGSGWGVGVPGWLKMPSRPFPRKSSGASASTGTSGMSDASGPSVTEVYSSTVLPRTPNELGYSVLETPGMIVDPEMQDKFRTAFAFDERETLLGYFPGYIYRVLPVHGRLYISTNYFCFKAGNALTSKTRMIIPIRDVFSTESGRAFHFGHHGLIINLSGHEELFFEFNTAERKRAFATLLERRKEELLKRTPAEESPSALAETHSALIFEDFEPTASPVQELESDNSATSTDPLADSQSNAMFTSASSGFLTFKPKQPLHFTFLTIGSRGDVQPYIALAKGLMADGHKVRIATHGEFKEWIEAHGIEYGYVGGDPAELMRICVENGLFTVSFLREALQKFRGWLDDLLLTSWLACQGTDVLVESPSAMGGYHIAEALQIPYFRAFTMTWTRTRAYPHAFAVPERKMGGSYNYMTYVMFDQVFWRAIAGQVNRWRQKTMGIGSTTFERMEPHKIPFLYNFSPTVVPPPLDWPDWIRVTGYWFLDDAEVGSTQWSPPADLVEFIDGAHRDGKKVVYIGFGSIVVSDPKAMTRCVVDAIERSGVHAILSKGWSDRLQTKASETAEPEVPLPKQIYQVTSIPHDWLFRRIDAACHHGGAGTTGASLRAGIPTIIKPFFGDQFFWADRMEALGIGSGVRKLTVESLTHALTVATTNAKVIERARVVGERIRSENGVGTAVEAIYRDLEYARSLIKRRGAGDDTDESVDAENATIRDPEQVLSAQERARVGASGRNSGSMPYGSAPSASSDWSVISDGGDEGADRLSPRSSPRSRRTSFGGRADRPKRNSLVAAALSVLPDAITSSGSRPRAPRSISSPAPA